MNLSAEHVSVLRGRTEIVHDVSFSVSDGQWLMICGPNGAGKSTLLSAVSQELPYAGLVTLDGTDLRRMKPRQLARRMAMLRQLSDLAYAYTVEEVVAMGRYAHRGLLQADNGGAEAVEHALQAVQLQDKRRQNILTLSGGERQRVYLAMALAQDAARAGAVSGAGCTAAGRTRQPFGFALPAGVVSAHRRMAARTGTRGGIRRPRPVPCAEVRHARAAAFVRARHLRRNFRHPDPLRAGIRVADGCCRLAAVAGGCVAVTQGALPLDPAREFLP